MFHLPHGKIIVTWQNCLLFTLTLRSFGSRYAVSHTRIELCTLGYRAGVIGAAMLARE